MLQSLKELDPINRYVVQAEVGKSLVLVKTLNAESELGTTNKKFTFFELINKAQSEVPCCKQPTLPLSYV